MIYVWGSWGLLSFCEGAYDSNAKPFLRYKAFSFPDFSDLAILPFYLFIKKTDFKQILPLFTIRRLKYYTENYFNTYILSSLNNSQELILFYPRDVKVYIF